MKLNKREKSKYSELQLFLIHSKQQQKHRLIDIAAVGAFNRKKLPL